MSKEINHIVLSTNYLHHADNSGYEILAKYTKPIKVLGINEKRYIGPEIYKKYKWLFELKAKIQYSYNLIHIYYGEEYYRFSTLLNPHKPVVVTFHQPPGILEREVLYGDVMGRAYGFTHRLTRNRFKNLSAAIILNENQRKVLEKVMPGERIHFIPHGIEVNKNLDIHVQKRNNEVLTVGNWLRDWRLYEDILEESERLKLEFKFILVNRSIEKSILNRLNKYSCFQYLENIDDKRLIELYKSSLCMLLPLKESTANNALNEALAYGCPVILTPSQMGNKSIYTAKTKSDFLNELIKLKNMNSHEKVDLSQKCVDSVKDLSWEYIADQTLALYSNIIND